jgi:hypothetical protein
MEATIRRRIFFSFGGCPILRAGVKGAEPPDDVAAADDV